MLILNLNEMNFIPKHDRFYEIFIFNFNLFMRIVSIIQFKKENSDKRIIIE